MFWSHVFPENKCISITAAWFFHGNEVVLMEFGDLIEVSEIGIPGCISLPKLVMPGLSV